MKTTRHCEHCELSQSAARSNLNQYKSSKEIASRRHAISPAGFAMTGGFNEQFHKCLLFLIRNHSDYE